MPVYEVQGPDGVYEVEAPDEASALRAFSTPAPTTPAPAAPAAPAVDPSLARATGLGGRAAMTGIISGWGAPASIVADSVMGVGRDIAYAGKKALSKTGLVEPPNPENYYDESKGAFPVVAGWSKFAEKPANLMGLPTPETSGEKMAVATIEGAAGATTPIGMGKAIAKFGPRALQRAGEFLSAQPVAQTAAGALGGAASSAVTEAGAGKAAPYAGVAASLVPLVLTAGRGAPKRITSSSEAGQRSVAGAILREQAADPASALHNLETHAPEIAGWQHTGVAAARDPGLGALDARLHDFSKLHDASAPARIAENNSTILSNAMDRLGARGGSADAARRDAQILAREAENRMFHGQTQRTPIDISDMIDDLRTHTLRNGADTATAETAEALRNRLIAASEPVMQNNQVVGYTIDPLNLHRARTDLTNMPVGPSAGASRRSGKTSFSKGMERGYQTWADDLLTENTGGQYQRYIGQQRNFRGSADQQAFMADMAADVNPSGRFYETGARDIDTGKMLRRTSEKNVDRAIPGGDSKYMSLERLEELAAAGDTAAGMRADFLRRAQSDINTGTYAQRSGSGARGSNTISNADINEMIFNRTRAGLGVGSRLATRLLPLAETATYGASAAMGTVGGAPARGATNFAARALTGGVKRRLTGNLEGSVEAVQANLGRAYTDPAFMAELMRQAPIQGPNWRGVGGRAAGATGRGLLTGSLASGSGSRYR